MARLLDEIQTDFGLGLFDSIAATRFPRNAVAALVNGRVRADGTIERRLGSRRKHAAALFEGAGYGGFDFVSAAGDRQLLVFFGNRAFVSSDRGATWTDVTPLDGGGASRLTEGYYSFATMRVGASVYLFCANGAAVVWRWDGSTMDALPNAPEGVQFLAVFNGRLWAAGHDGPIVQASRIADPETWSANSGGLLVQVVTHDADPITAIYQIGPHLLVFDRNATSYIDGFGEATLVIASGATGFSRSVGCLGFRTIAAVGDNAICWLSERGIEHYVPGSGIRLASGNIRGVFEAVSRVALLDTPGVASATYDPIREEYYLAIAEDGIRNEQIIVLRPDSGAIAVDDFPEADGEMLLDVDAEGYLATAGLLDDGAVVAERSDGYLSLGASGSGGEAIGADDEGAYLESVDVGHLPVSLFMAPGDDLTPTLHSLGYDGFVRQHGVGDTDDALSDGSGGSAIECLVVSRPFHLGNARARKRFRGVHVGSINEQAATLSVAVRAGGATSLTHHVVIPATTFDQPRRKEARVSIRGDAGQVEVRTTDRMRLALVGVTAEVLREVT